mmetsp:Transcript_27702/g.85643  ORF Transcript_27702/g.85643 Transcript_27702/m.85643 type:complete len:110 (-) Transcript_27702:643-972(-)
MSSLLEACGPQGGYLDVVMCIRNGDDVNTSTDHGETGLWITCRWGHVDAATYLLDRGADVNRANRFGSTPLSIACFKGQTACVRLCLDRGADVHRAVSEGGTPLYRRPR